MNITPALHATAAKPVCAHSGEPLYSLVQQNGHYGLRKNLRVENTDELEAMLDPTRVSSLDNMLLAVLNNLEVTQGRVFVQGRRLIGFFAMHDGTWQAESCDRSGQAPVFCTRYNLDQAEVEAEQAGLLERGYTELGQLGWPEWVKEANPTLAKAVSDAQARPRFMSNREPEFA